MGSNVRRKKERLRQQIERRLGNMVEEVFNEEVENGKRKKAKR